jgi:hypothetical protein
VQDDHAVPHVQKRFVVHDDEGKHPDVSRENEEPRNKCCDTPHTPVARAVRHPKLVIPWVDDGDAASEAAIHRARRFYV